MLRMRWANNAKFVTENGVLTSYTHGPIVGVARTTAGQGLPVCADIVFKDGAVCGYDCHTEEDAKILGETINALCTMVHHDHDAGVQTFWSDDATPELRRRFMTDDCTQWDNA